MVKSAFCQFRGMCLNFRGMGARFDPYALMVLQYMSDRYVRADRRPPQSYWEGLDLRQAGEMVPWLCAITWPSEMGGFFSPGWVGMDYVKLADPWPDISMESWKKEYVVRIR